MTAPRLGADSPEVWEDVARVPGQSARYQARLARLSRLLAYADDERIAWVMALTLGVEPEDLTEDKEKP